MTTAFTMGADLGLNTARFTAGLEAAGLGVVKFENQFKTAMRGLGVASGAAVLALGAVAAATRKAVDFASEINDASTAAGIASETYQAWSYSARLAGVSSEEFAGAMAKANVQIGKAAAGEAGAVALFKRLGISARDTSGHVRSTEDVINDFSDSLSKFKSASERGALSAEFLGKAAGPKLASTMAQGSAALAEATAKAREAGAVIDDSLIQQADAAGDKLDALSIVIKAELSSALIQLVPMISDVSGAFAKAIPYVSEFYQVITGTGLRGLEVKLGLVAEKIADINAEIALRSKPSGDPEWSMKRRNDLMEELRLQQEKEASLQRQHREMEQAPKSSATRSKGRDEAAIAAAAAEAKRLAKEAERAKRSNDLERFIANSAVNQMYEPVNKPLTFAQEFADTYKKTLADIEDEFKQSFVPSMKVATESFYAELKQQSDDAAATIVDGLDQVFTSGFRGGLKEMEKTFVRFLANLALRAAESKLEQSLSGLFTSAGERGGGSGFLNIAKGALGWLFGGKGAEGAAAGGAAAGGAGGVFDSLSHNATGGSFTVPGSGSADNVIPLFKATPGETVTIAPKSTPLQGGGVTINQTIDARGADPGSELRLRAAMNQATAKAVAMVQDAMRRGRL